jgi:hypothetical protein
MRLHFFSLLLLEKMDPLTGVLVVVLIVLVMGICYLTFVRVNEALKLEEAIQGVDGKNKNAHDAISSIHGTMSSDISRLKHREELHERAVSMFDEKADQHKIDADNAKMTAHNIRADLDNLQLRMDGIEKNKIDPTVNLISDLNKQNSEFLVAAQDIASMPPYAELQQLVADAGGSNFSFERDLKTRLGALSSALTDAYNGYGLLGSNYTALEGKHNQVKEAIQSAEAANSQASPFLYSASDSESTRRFLLQTAPEPDALSAFDNLHGVMAFSGSNILMKDGYKLCLGSAQTCFPMQQNPQP